MFALAFIVLLETVSVHSQTCEGLDNGFYCIDDTSYLWCYGQKQGQKSKCQGTTVCKCGRTAYNPCVWSWTDLPDCSLKPGDYFESSETPDLPDESSSAAPPKPESSEEPTPESSSKPPEPPEESSSEPQKPESSEEPKPEESSEKPQSSSEQEESSEENIEKKMVSYFTNWAQYRWASIDGWACKFTPENVDPTIVDVINYAFVVFDSSYTVKEYEWNDDQNIPKIVALKSRNPNLQVLASIGGWNFNFFESTKHLFSEMAEKQTSRATFIKSAMDFARKYNLDGIDIDWEYPANEDQGGRPVDTQSFTLLLKEFREAINAEKLTGNRKRLLLTIAAPAGPKNIVNLEVSKFHPYLDWINLMTYDLHGAWDEVTGSHTALYADDTLSVHDCVQAYLTEGVPPHKLIVGMAHYGRGWTLTFANDHLMGSPTSGASRSGQCTGENGYLAKYEIDAAIPSSNVQYDPESMTMYGYSGDQFFSFDDQTTFKYKTDYVCKHKLGGAMIWSLDLDKNYVNTKFIKKQIDKC
ncbi:chitotriosidase-1 precursor, putative [Entamoeba invadens IP1]|uniref:Chitotriosidase-1, putative n=2 Tax=Entamoeba invadens TaxID=33085 RepID=A0A0A1TXF4_ENTIV|nr:chitotriosidase-1 precursor, putative [Entamoeba invadens IP1]ELP85968.1 chitotriosidase-1 precursor, putative [Entamoeba invadens IP1]BAK18782.1 chitinase [Entamoeba invadens]|eukprot:XP_004185314.1 chitotriosidase-1 precursor, putative [Entamoeba invadens IP1]